MSREIKFRAWDKDSKRYGEVVEVEYNESREIDGVWVWYNIHERYEPIPGESATIEQYTGLKDKNGKEIYEGDIVEGDMGVFEVKWYDLVAQFMFRPNIDMKWHPPFVSDQVNEMEVIGNIHENPELLKKED